MSDLFIREEQLKKTKYTRGVKRGKVDEELMWDYDEKDQRRRRHKTDKYNLKVRKKASGTPEGRTPFIPTCMLVIIYR